MKLLKYAQQMKANINLDQAKISDWPTWPACSIIPNILQIAIFLMW